MTETDIDLIEGLREQSPKAQRQTLQRYGNGVFAQVARLLPSTEDAEEVYQDVFVKVFRNIKMYDADKSSLKTWISRIAYNEAVTWLRHKRQAVIYFEDREGGAEKLSDAEVEETLGTVDTGCVEASATRRARYHHDVLLRRNELEGYCLRDGITAGYRCLEALPYEKENM